METAKTAAPPNPILVKMLVATLVAYVIASTLTQAHLYTKIVDLEHRIEHLQDPHGH